jgi:plasmid stabilization system protein ParE
MSFIVKITDIAHEDLADIQEFLIDCSVDKKTANEIVKKIYGAIMKLSHLPRRYRLVGREFELPMEMRSQLALKKYVVLYQIKQHEVIIHRVFDARQDYQNLLNL